jgi:hypothetical protein
VGLRIGQRAKAAGKVVGVEERSKVARKAAVERAEEEDFDGSGAKGRSRGGLQTRSSVIHNI